jgi:hypothetical protein
MILNLFFLFLPFVDRPTAPSIAFLAPNAAHCHARVNTTKTAEQRHERLDSTLVSSVVRKKRKKEKKNTLCSESRLVAGAENYKIGESRLTQPGTTSIT